MKQKSAATKLKQAIIESYSRDEMSQEQAIRLIRLLNLKSA